MNRLMLQAPLASVLRSGEMDSDQRPEANFAYLSIMRRAVWPEMFNRIAHGVRPRRWLWG